MEITMSPISKEQWKKVLKAAAYLFVSAVISAVLAAIADNPALFGVFTPVVNILLVTVKQLFTEAEPQG
jgi:uncharacterized membrane protein YoaK (UPF0700 family)